MKKRFLKLALLPALLLGALAMVPAGEAKAHDVHRRHHHHFGGGHHCYPAPHVYHRFRAYRAYPVPVYAPVPFPYRAPVIPYYGRPGLSIGFSYGF